MKTRRKKPEISKLSTRLEFEVDQLKQIYEAAEIENRSAKNFMETSVIAATIQTLSTKK